VADNQNRINTLSGSVDPEASMNTNGSSNDKQVSGRQDCWMDIASDPGKLKYWKEIARLWRGSLDCRIGLEGRGKG